MASSASDSEWIGLFCGVALVFRESGLSILELMVGASPDFADGETFRSGVARHLRHHPGEILAWSGYSMDKRTGGGPYFKPGPTSEVGVFSSDYQDVVCYDDSADACADFLWREFHLIKQHPCWPAAEEKKSNEGSFS